MDDQLALLAAVLEFPEQDAPRLIYADWLDEHGELPGPAGRAGSSGGAGPGTNAARAEFIRVSCELEWRPYTERRTPHYRELLVRFRTLIAAHRAAWVAPFTAEPTRVLFRRGFVEWARLSAEEVVRIEDAALAREPLFELEVFGNRAPGSDALPDGDEAARRLAAWPGRGRFRKLTLTGLSLTPAARQELWAAPVAENAALDASGCAFRGG